MSSLKAIRIQFRLNPHVKDKRERRALAIYQRLRKGAEGDRELFTELLLRVENDPLSSTIQAAEMNEALNIIVTKIDEQQAKMQELIVNALQSLDLSQFINHDGRSVADELGDIVPEGVYSSMLANSRAQEFDVE